MCLWQAPASTEKTKRKTRPAIRRSARWRVKTVVSKTGNSRSALRGGRKTDAQPPRKRAHNPLGAGAQPPRGRRTTPITRPNNYLVVRPDQSRPARTTTRIRHQKKNEHTASTPRPITDLHRNSSGAQATRPACVRAAPRALSGRGVWLGLGPERTRWRICVTSMCERGKLLAFDPDRTNRALGS